ncbi:MAG: sigma-54-dependent Fis family transcriptional regulator [bacterium]|nr:sigma-54-dependent Fis family transcriptional regulator [bacterium]
MGQKVLQIAYIEDSELYHHTVEKRLNNKIVRHKIEKENPSKKYYGFSDFKNYEVTMYKLKVRTYETITEFMADKEFAPDIILLDIKLHGSSEQSLSLTKLAKSIFPDVILIIFSIHNCSEKISEYMNAGADSYITKSTDMDVLAERIIHEYEICKNPLSKAQNQITVKKRSLKRHKYFGETINRISKRLSDLVEKGVRTVHIWGEPGTGKSIATRLLKEELDRREQKHIELNAANVAYVDPYELYYELFGYEKEAFEGAIDRKKGYIERAKDGYLIIEEIDCLPIEVQRALLDCLEEKEFKRIGGSETIEADFHLITISRVDISELVRERLFLKALYAKISIAMIDLLPLRKRRYEIAEISTEIAANLKDGPYKIEEEVMEILEDYEWRENNVRELINTLESMVEHVDKHAKVFSIPMVPTEIMEAVKSITYIRDETSFPIDLKKIKNNPFKDLEEDFLLHVLKLIIEKYKLKLFSHIPRYINLARTSLISKHERLSPKNKAKIKSYLEANK